MSQYTLLYAEDDTLIRDNLSILFKEHFDRVLAVANGEEAFTLYQKGRPDVLLLDICMPGMDGLELARKIREEDQEIPIIMLTAHTDKDRLLRAVSLKLEAYLVKPVDFKELDMHLASLRERLERNNIVHLKKDLVWDTKNQLLRHNTKVIKLTKKEKQTIEILAKNLNKFVPNDTLIYQIWEDEMPDESHDNKLIQLIYRLNKKIYEETCLYERLIENSYTLGYRVLNVEETLS